MNLKKDGVACEVSRLNAVTVPERYNIPFSLELHGKTISSKFDLKKAYHQIKVQDNDIHKTALVTKIAL